MRHGLTGYVKHKCRCDVCREAMSVSKKRSYRKNLERNRLENRRRYNKWRAENPERAKQLARETSQRYADKNREKVREKNREWREAHPEEAKAFSLAYRLANPHKAREAAKRRRVRMSGGVIKAVSERDWQRLCMRYNFRCFYCGADGELEKDHVVPITRGGHHSIGNLLPSCKPCNSSKNDRLLVEWGGRINDRPTYQFLVTRT